MNRTIFDIRNYGAKGDGVTDATAAIQAAIDACSSAGGGMVLVHGGVYFIRPLTLHSGVNLHIAAGASLSASINPEDYPLCSTCGLWRADRAPRNSNTRHLIYAEGAKNIAITGRGRIECNGQDFLIKEDDNMIPPRWKRKSDLMIPARTILLVACEDVLLEDISIIDSAGWTTWFLDCDRVQIEKVKVLAHRKIPNSDGLHIDACRDVTISNCVVKTGDDSIAVCSRQAPLNKPKPCERIAISNCSLQSDRCAIRIGWSGQYEIRNVTVNNIVIDNTTCGIGMRIWPYYANGPVIDGIEDGLPLLIERVSFNNIIMNGIVHRPVEISVEKGLREICFHNDRHYGVNVEKGLQVRAIRDISLSNIQSNSNWPPLISGLPGCELVNINLNNVNMRVSGADCSQPLFRQNNGSPLASAQECLWHFSEYGGVKCPKSYICPAMPQYFHHVRNLVLNNFQLTNEQSQTMLQK